MVGLTSLPVFDNVISIYPIGTIFQNEYFHYIYDWNY